jgi:hypothetical protein
MRDYQCFGDERTLGFCAFCGDAPQDRDHCPSKILLDDPLPEDPPYVPSCRKCNESFSLDEEYLACLIECVLAGTTELDKLRRPKIARTLAHAKELHARLEAAKQLDGTQTIFAVEHERVQSVLIKLAQGHALHELHEACPRPPNEFRYRPLTMLTGEQRSFFEHPPSPAGISLWPEVGSRAMQRIVESGDEWIVLQPGRYRYAASLHNGISVRLVLSEFIAGFVRWNLTPP